MMHRLLQRLASLPRLALMGLVRLWRLTIGPSLGPGCRFEPSCSVYALQALEKHGALGGSYLAASRILRCQPWCQAGHDPVPDQLAQGLPSLFRPLLARGEPAPLTHKKSS